MNKVRKKVTAILCMCAAVIWVLTAGAGKITVLAAEHPLSVSLSPTGNEYEYQINVSNTSSGTVTVYTMHVALYTNYDGEENYWGDYGDIYDEAGNVVVESADAIVNSSFSIAPGETMTFVAEPALQYSGFIPAYTSEGAFISVSIGSPDARGDLAQYRYVIAQDAQESEPPVPPEITEGNNGNWEKGNTEGLTFRSSADLSGFQKVLVDDNELPESVYTVSEGSTIVTLSAEYLDTLTAGEHTISIVSDSGTAAGTFTVAEKEQDVQDPAGTPETGEDTGSGKDDPSTEKTETSDQEFVEEDTEDEKQEDQKNTEEEQIVASEDKQAEQQPSSYAEKSPKTGDQGAVFACMTITLAAAMVICFAFKKIYR